MEILEFIFIVITNLFISDKSEDKKELNHLVKNKHLQK